MFISVKNYNRIEKPPGIQTLKYGITVRYNPKLSEAKALPESLKKDLEGYESADSLIAKVNALVNQLKSVG